MAQYRFQFETLEEREQIIIDNADKQLISVECLVNGNFLVFDDSPSVIEQLEQENAFMALQLIDTQARLDQSEQAHADLLLTLVMGGVV